MKRVYVAYPYSDDPEKSKRVCRAACRQIVDEGNVPIPVQLFLEQFMCEESERGTILNICTGLVAGCDELRLYYVEGEDLRITPGMSAEIDRACREGVTVTLGVVNPDDYPLKSIP